MAPTEMLVPNLDVTLTAGDGDDPVLQARNAVHDAVSLHAAGAGQGLPTRPSWIVCDPAIMEPTRIAFGSGVPGLDAPWLVLTVDRGVPLEQVVDIYLVARRVVGGARVEVFDKTGAGLPLWQRICQVR